MSHTGGKECGGNSQSNCHSHRRKIFLYKMTTIETRNEIDNDGADELRGAMGVLSVCHGGRRTSVFLHPAGSLLHSARLPEKAHRHHCLDTMSHLLLSQLRNQPSRTKEAKARSRDMLIERQAGCPGENLKRSGRSPPMCCTVPRYSTGTWPVSSITSHLTQPLLSSCALSPRYDGFEPGIEHHNSPEPGTRRPCQRAGSDPYAPSCDCDEATSQQGSWTLANMPYPYPLSPQPDRCG